MTLPSGKAAGCGLYKPLCTCASGEEVWKHRCQGGRASGVSPVGPGACGWLCSVVGDRLTAPQHHVCCFCACLGNMQINIAVSASVAAEAD